MKRKIYPSFDAAVADIPDGCTIMFGGFGGVGAPQNLMAALLSKGATGITGISNEHGGIDGRMDIGTLIEARQISKMICSFTSNPHPSRATHSYACTIRAWWTQSWSPWGRWWSEYGPLPLASAVFTPPPGPELNWLTGKSNES